MYFFVKTEVSRDKVDEFTRRLASGQIHGVQGNMSYVSQDGCYGFDIVECNDQNECRRKYDHLTQYGLRILDVTPVETMGQFLASYKQQRPAA